MIILQTSDFQILYHTIEISENDPISKISNMKRFLSILLSVRSLSII
jgi:hypothetical protein